MSVTHNIATGTVQTIQFLRFVAAGMVLLAHVSFFVHHRVDQAVPVVSVLAQGVALFFVISGFIMTVTANPNVGQPGFVRYFVLSRLIRIVPLYWAINAAKLVGFILVPSLIAANPTVSNVLFSLLFLPAKNADGKIEAFYGVGWSLNFEMAFYALFAFALLVGRRPTGPVIAFLLTATVLSFFKTDDWPTAAYLLRPGLLNFVWGILIGEWYLSGRKLPVTVSLGLIAVGTAVLFVSAPGLETIVATSLHMGMIVLGFVALEDRIGHTIPKLLTFLGDASYSLYLTHPMLGVLAVVVLHRLAPWIPSSALFFIVVVLCLLFSTASFVWFERPVTRWLRKRLVNPGRLGRANP